MCKDLMHVSVLILHYLVTPPRPKAHSCSNQAIILHNDITKCTLTCVADGATFYKWQKYSYRGIPGNITNHGRLSSTLTLVKLQPHYNGSYRCRASNASGTGFSDFVTVDIKGLFITHSI